MPDTQSNELFELCREVYGKTGWTDTKEVLLGADNAVERNSIPYDSQFTPLYTSDYLLEKLLPITGVQLKRKASGGIRLFYFPDEPDYATYDYDTPLKCLLALTITLCERGKL